MSYLLLAHVAVQPGLGASALLRKQAKISLCSFERQFLSGLHLPSQALLGGTRLSCRQARQEGRAAPCHLHTVSAPF